MYDGWENTYTIWKDNQSFKLTPLQGKEKDKGKAKVVIFGRKEIIKLEDGKSNLFSILEQSSDVGTAKETPKNGSKKVETHNVKVDAHMEKQIPEKTMKENNLRQDHGKLLMTQQGEVNQVEEILIGTMVCPITVYARERQSSLRRSLQYDNTVMYGTVSAKVVGLMPAFKGQSKVNQVDGEEQSHKGQYTACTGLKMVGVGHALVMKGKGSREESPSNIITNNKVGRAKGWFKGLKVRRFTCLGLGIDNKPPFDLNSEKRARFLAYRGKNTKWATSSECPRQPRGNTRQHWLGQCRKTFTHET